jgi:hypothetical protein
VAISTLDANSMIEFAFEANRCCRRRAIKFLTAGIGGLAFLRDAFPDESEGVDGGVERVPGTDLTYFLIPFDASGVERPWRGGLVSRRAITKLMDQPIADLRSQLASGSLEPPRRLNPTVPARLEKVCLKALAKDAGERYATAEAFGTALRKALRPGLVTRVRVAAAAVLGAVAICSGLGIYLSRPPADRDNSADRASGQGKKVSSPRHYSRKVAATEGIGDISGLNQFAATGILVEKGQMIEIHATGEWRVGPLEHHLKGPEVLRAAIGTASKPPQQFVECGEQVEFEVEHSGELFLGIVDVATVDNSGELSVEVDVR